MIKIGFDFSCNKPACLCKTDDQYNFFVWPLELDEKSIKMLIDAGINVTNRSRMKEGTNSSEKMRVHSIMANNLTNLIIETITNFVKEEKPIIAFEGSAFSSKGDAGLQLSGYRYILVNELGKLYGFENIWTFAPLSVKSDAGCAKKEQRGKDSMIEAFKNENINHTFCQILRESPEKLKKKTNYVSCVDDLVDSYFVLKTLEKRVLLSAS